MTTEPVLDHRLHAYRTDLADRRLEGRVPAARFVDGERRRIGVAATPFRGEPRLDASFLTEALRGEVVRVFETTPEGWAWAQLETDGYVGWLAADALLPLEPEPTHSVTALRTFLFPGPDLKLPPVGAFSFGCRLALGIATATRGVSYLPLLNGEGAVAAAHVAPLETPPALDFVAVAERFQGVPYLWGGRTSLGLDCSALVQLALMGAGRPAPRDSDLQEAELGVPVERGVAAGLQRGDLVFWQGHVGIMRDDHTLLHANAHHMAVASEPLTDAVNRIAASYGKVTSVRRLT